MTLGCWHPQNHRMAGVGRDLCGSSSPTLLSKQGHLQQASPHLQLYNKLGALLQWRHLCHTPTSLVAPQQAVLSSYHYLP